MITSSLSSICRAAPGVNKVFTEEDWSDVKYCPPYDKSKTIAEQKAWEFVNDLPEDQKFSLSVVNPVLIVGPSFIKCQSSSVEAIRGILAGEHPGLPRVMLPVVDIREVA